MCKNQRTQNLAIISHIKKGENSGFIKKFNRKAFLKKLHEKYLSK